MINQSNLLTIIEPRDGLSEALRLLMKSKNVSEADLSRKTNIPQPTLHKILTGKTIDPRASTLKALADFFNVSLDCLLSGENIQDKHDINSKVGQTVPIISWRDCIQAKPFIKNLSATNWNDWIVIEPLASPVYALTTKPCMQPRFPKGSILIVDPDFPAQDGDIVVAHYPNSEEATLRELSIDGPNKTLMPMKNDITTTFDNNIKILGVVTKSIFLFH